MTTSPPKHQRPPAAGESSRPPFAFSGLLAPLIEAGHEEDAREVVQFFLEDYAAKLHQITRAFEHRDLGACATAAHSLVGAAGAIGARELAFALDALEKACRAGDLDAVNTAKATVETEQEPVLLAARTFAGQETVEG